MVRVIFVKNPFSPSRERVVKLSEATNKPLSFYIDEFTNQLPKNEAYIEIDGRKVPAEYLDTCNEIVKPNSFIVVMPKVAKGGGGKSLLGLVAVIALSVVSFGVGGLAATGTWGAAVGTWGAGAVWGYMAAAAVMFLGGSLISKFMAPKVDTGKYQTEDPTYSWNGVQTMDAQGNGIAITYGKVKSGGQSLQKFTNNNGDDQYFNWLISAGEGPLTISNIKLNDNPIGNYEAVSYQTRGGTNNQSIISGFGDTYVNKSVSYEVETNAWRTDEVDSNVAQGIVIEMECSQGLYHANDNGSLGTAWVRVTAQYALSGSGNWVTFVNNYQISGAKSGVVRKQFRVDGLASGKYQVRVTVNSRSADVNSSRDGVKIWWTQVNAIIYDDFSYPNTALIGIRAKATSQLSGSTPQLTFYKERANVWVWNPTTGSYEQKAANNPAWAAYDFVHGAKRLYNIRTGAYEFVYDGVPKELMLYDQFLAWANNCDTMNLKINIEIVSVSDFWSIVNQDIAPVGRGLVVQFGTKFGCIYDHASQPVQLFNMGNIVQGSFELSYLGVEDRADVVEVTYFDSANDYEKSTITIYADDYDSIDIPNQPTQLTYNGITSYQQAYREGKYQLFCNKLLQETITFKADVEAISCQVGDQILVSHDVPEWSFSGRIGKVNADGSVVVALDIENIDTVATNGLMVRNSETNTLTTYTVTSIIGKYGEITVKASAPIDAKAGDLFSLGKINAIVKPFIVKSLQKSGDLEYTISALEYVEGVYSEDYTIPEPNYSLALKTLTPVTNLKVSENLYTNDSGELLKTVYLTWQGSGLANIYVSIDGGETFYLAGQSERNSASIEISPTVDYIAKVCTTNGSIETTPVIYNGQNSSAAFDLSPATNFRLEGQKWLWDAVDNGYIDYYELRLDQNPGKDEGLLDRTFVKCSTVMPNVASGTAYLYIKSKTGAYSEPASYAFNISLPPKPSKPLLTASLDGVNILMDELPAGCTHYKIEISSDDGVEPRVEYFVTKEEHFAYFLYDGRIIVRYMFVNNLGEGEYSDTVSADIQRLQGYKIPDGAIAGTKIEENSITSAQIAANTIVANNLAADCVTSEKILAESVTSEKIATNAITANKIAAGSVSTEKLAAEAISLTGALSIVGGAVKLSEEGLRLTANDNSYTLFNGDGINYVDKNGVVYAQVKKMIIGKAYDGQYIRFAAPWESVPSVITVPMSIRTNDVNYQASTTTIVCEATEISQNGFRVNNYLKLASGSYAVINANKAETLALNGLASMTQYGYGRYTYHYTMAIYSNCLSISIPSTANYLEVSLNISSVNNVGVNGDIDIDYPGANSGWTRADNSTWYIKVELIVNGAVVATASYSTTSGTHTVNTILSARFSAGATSAFVRVTYTGNFSTNEHGDWSTIYNGWTYIAKAVFAGSKITMPYYKYSASESKIAQGYAMFLVTDGSTNTYTIE